MSEPLRFFSGGGEPPRSHEVLLVDPAGDAWYLTGMPWPAQPPFHEIGAYRIDLGAEVYARLAELARGAIDAPEPEAGPAGSGTESATLGAASANWSRNRRTPPALALVDAAREAITAAREHPYAVAGAALLGSDRLRLLNRGAHPLPVADGELRAGWGALDSPATPWHFAQSEGLALELPPQLRPGAPIEVELPPAGPRDDPDLDTLYALVSLQWRPPVQGEGEVLDGWLVAGPG